MEFKYDVKTIQHILNATSIITSPNATIEWLLIDSRKIIRAESSLFFAIKGKTDAMQFIPYLYQQGVRNFVVSEAPAEISAYPDANFYIVQDTLKAMQAMASAHRQQFQIPVIGITGSNGKTIVKDWLYQLLTPEYAIARSPKSYNSQIGVPFSVWQMAPHTQLAIIEAGISQAGEMESLSEIISPTIGVMTNLKTAHAEGFKDNLEKLQEKLKLFSSAELVIIPLDFMPDGFNIPNAFTWSQKQTADLAIKEIQKGKNQTSISGLFKNQKLQITIPFVDDASIENAITCWAVMLAMGYDPAIAMERFLHLPAIQMRLELKQGINQTSIINDSYSADIASLYIAVDFLNQQQQYQHKSIILSDFSTTLTVQNYQEIITFLKSKGIQKFIGIGPEIIKNQNTADFLSHFNLMEFQEEVILIKGARLYEFEKIVNRLALKAHETVMEINLNAVVHNLNFYRSKLKKSTKIMAMVKAYSYGSGSFEIANVLAYNKVDYLAVAYVDEGVALRQAGIKLPIMVMSPEESGFELMLIHQLEPEIYSLNVLKSFIEFLTIKKANAFPIHLKIDTGMHRLGFDESDLSELVAILKGNKLVKVLSVFSHLASSDNSSLDEYTQKQLSLFEKITTKLKDNLAVDFMKHIANTAAILRFPEAQYDMVRLGIGLYGIENVGNFEDQLQTVGTLKTTITQIRKVSAGETIGYSRKGVLSKESLIATVKIGYADGYARRFGNGVGEMLVGGQLVKVVGNVCMDMCMLDVTGLSVNEGDEVIVFGAQYSINELAKKADTIPYEILTSISQRVKRIYYYE
jgi:alanine racemase